MANATLSTYNVVGTREDLSDLLSNISPTDAPFQKMCRKGKVTNTRYEWQTEALEPINLNNAVLEGADAPAASQQLTVKQYNNTQILTKTARVTGTGDVTKKAGRGKEMAHSVMNRTKELKIDLEGALVQNSVAVAGDLASAAASGHTDVIRKLRGLEGWIGENQDFNGSGGTAPNPEANTGYVDGGAATPFSEARLNTVLDKCYNTGGNPDTIMAAPVNRRIFSGFEGISSAQNADVTSNKIINTMSVYESDWGTLKVVPNRFQRNRTVFVLDSSGFELVTLRPLQTKDLPANGDYEVKQLLMEVGLKVDNWKAHGAVRDIG